jgi:hypothetical protein
MNAIQGKIVHGILSLLVHKTLGNKLDKKEEDTLVTLLDEFAMYVPANDLNSAKAEGAESE